MTKSVIAITTTLCMVFGTLNSIALQEPIKPDLKVPTVAILPWTFAENEKGTSEPAMNTANDTLKKLFEKRASFEIISEAKCKKGWEQVGEKELPATVEELGQLPLLPFAQKLLALGQLLEADFVCVGTLGWTVRSVWVGLGPKTKAYAIVNVMIVDVKKKEICLDQKDFRSDSGKAEKWYETAGALFLAWGITLFSGGPKTPHMQNAAIKGIGAATDPFFSAIGKKIGG